MNKIILIYPSLMDLDASNVILPLSLIYIATPLKGQFDIHIIDQRVDKEWRRTLTKELQSGSVTCAGISSMTGPQISGAIEAASVVRKISPAVPIVWGGVHPSLAPEQTIKNDLVDIVVIGDGEETFKEIVEMIQNGGDKKIVRGIIYKEKESIVRTPMREQFPISKIDNPAYDLIDIGRYNFMPPWVGKNTIPVLTSRGCPMRCSYCYNTQFSQKKWTSLSPEQTVTLINRLVEKYEIRDLSLLDDNFFVNLNRVKRICELIIDNDFNIEFHNVNCRVDTIAKMDDEFLELLKKAGFKQLFVGVESGSNRVLSRIKKDITVEQILTVSTKLKNAGINSFYSFMAGFPFETVDDIKKTVLLMKRLLTENPDANVYKLQIYTPFPGTELFHYLSTRGMKFPTSLEGWATYHYDRINYNGFNKEHRDFLKDMNFYTIFLDRKLFDGLSKYLRPVSYLYSKTLSFRIDRRCYSCMYELYLIKMLQKFQSRLRGKDPT